MTDVNRNARWARLIAEELARAGVSHVVLCPGSRNSPLLFALAAQFGECACSHVDERSAGFIALGLIRASATAVAVCVTSGSALANLLPAVCEADAAELPLIVISADRPWEAQHCSAPQTMPQPGIFQHFIRAQVALGEPTDDERSLCALRAQVSRLAQTKHGPSHLNVPLRDPLPPLADPQWQAPALSREAESGRDSAYVVVHHAESSPSLAPQPWLRPGLRGLIVVGSLTDHQLSDTVATFAAATGFPLLADAASHLRHPAIPQLIVTADGLLSGRLQDENPELIIQIGPAPLTRAVYEWLARQRCPWISMATERNQDALGRAWVAINGPWAAPLAQLGTWLAPGDRVWRERWLAADAAAREILAQATPALGWSESLAVRSAVNHPGFGFVHLASSMAIRHANLHLLPSSRPVHANRGVNGIDGTLGTFLGECRGHHLPGVLVIGDLAFLHDLPALASAALATAGGAIVVIDNGGGGIFDYLPVAQVPGYATWVRTSHSLDFTAAGTLFGLPCHNCQELAQLQAALTSAAATVRLHLIICRLRAGDAVAQHRSLIQAIVGLEGNG
jgi:2-succinyl-5-enolpyruvyl-6-hydroxy-3-cyclohexene-1-carboxylate synthase